MNRPQSSLDFIFSVNNQCCIKGIVIMGEGKRWRGGKKEMGLRGVEP